MKVILLKDIPRIGKKGEVKNVADGFAQNSLLPKKLATIATPQAIEALTTQKEHQQKIEDEKIQKRIKMIEVLQNSNLKVECAANDQGHLFSKFKIEQLKKILKEKNIDFDTAHIVPFEFKEIGVHLIKIKFPKDPTKKAIKTDDTFSIEIKGI